MSDESLYQPTTVRALFDEMAHTYGVVNLISSFGFILVWRMQAISRLPPTEPSAKAADLMTGMGELWRLIFDRFGPKTQLVAVDISEEMARRAPSNARVPVTLLVEDVLRFSGEPGTFDVVVSSFGLKTFSPEQQAQLASQVSHLLREGGSYSFVEISVPPGRSLRSVYMFYVNRVIPLIGRLLLGNPDNYRQLGVYTEAFGDCRHFARCLEDAGLEAQFVRYFFGCATGVVGQKPVLAS